jgi:kynureninase
VESQILHHGLDPDEAMVLISSSDSSDPCLSISDIYKVVDSHAISTAVLLLPGVQFYTGQLLDVQQITRYAQKKGIVVGWDLAHAVGNVELALHDWNVDFAVWCSYKYLNSGPGVIGGLFVHERHGVVENGHFKPRLSGWWGAEKGSRFKMENRTSLMSDLADVEDVC